MKFSAHPFWQVGFRPFFTLACGAGMILPLLWAAMFTGALGMAPNSPSVFRWHAHEMFFGFGWAVLGGFLLTATRNWVQIRGFHGRALIFLAAAWLFERLGMWFETSWPPLLFRISSNLFLFSMVAMLLWTLINHRSTDSYRRDNYFFLVALPVFIVAKNLLLGDDTFAIGWSMTLGLFRMAFLVMLERTLGQFMNSAFQVAILRKPLLDKTIKLFGLLIVFESLMPAQFSAALALLLAILLAGRFVFWYPHLAMRRIDIGIMYLGYLDIVLQLLLHFFDKSGGSLQFAWVGRASVHLFSFGVMGLIIPAMLIRIVKGHTGRKVVFDRGDRALLWIMIAGLLLRIVVPQIFPAGYALWIQLAAACWFLCFATIGWRYIPFLFLPRVDGKEH